MTSCNIAKSFQSFPAEFPENIQGAADSGFSWISNRFANGGVSFSDISIKDLSNLILSHLSWNYPQISFLYLQTLLLKQNENGSFGDLRDTARAVSALSAAYSYFESHAPEFDNTPVLSARGKAVHWILEQRKIRNDPSSTLYDTVYVLSALADAGIFEEEACLDLCKNDTSDRQHPGTTALILTALQKQKNLGLFNDIADFSIFEFISEESNWLLSVSENGFWKYTATSTLVLQALILCNQKHEAQKSLPWLLNSQKENGSWENDLNTTSLSLLAL